MYKLQFLCMLNIAHMFTMVQTVFYKTLLNGINKSKIENKSIINIKQTIFIKLAK